MTKREKRLQKMRMNPRNVTFDELISVLKNYGFSIRSIRGSHYFLVVEIRGRVWAETVARPHGGKKHVNRAAIKRALEDIDEIEEWRRKDE